MSLLGYTTSGPDNYQRAAWAASALDAFAQLTRNDPAEQEVTDAESLTEILRDFLCDVRHLCDEYGVNIETLFTDSREMRDVEVREDTEEPVDLTIERTTYTTVTVPAEELDALAEGWRDYIECITSRVTLPKLPADLPEEVRNGLERATATRVAAAEPDSTEVYDVVSIQLG